MDGRVRRQGWPTLVLGAYNHGGADVEPVSQYRPVGLDVLQMMYILPSDSSTSGGNKNS